MIPNFEAGYNPLPTPAPTPPPTLDPQTTPCHLAAQVTCTTKTGVRCDSLRIPTGMNVCDGSAAGTEPATSLSFLYTGASCGNTPNCVEGNNGRPILEAQVFMVIQINDVVVFDDLIQQEEIITLGGGGGGGDAMLGGQTTITVYPAATARQQQLVELDTATALQRISGINAECATLMTNYGAFQLVGFTSPSHGRQLVYEDISFTRTVTNKSPLPATLLSAVRAQPEVLDLIPQPSDGAPIILAGLESLVLEELTVRIDLLAGQDGAEVRQDLLVVGEGTQSGLECSDYDITVFSIPQS